ncbi:MAG TPA: hydantoinase B/oxoprolinase family protein [Anaerolineae bacterium]|nr:hydantoinase B/oxoprolinase family protein [Anaerolineae bacterium]
MDPITFEIFRSRLAAINDEAAMTLRLVSGSPVANEAYDMNTALMTPEGEAFAIGVYISIHAMSLASTVQSIQREYADNPGIAPDDIWMSNDPYVGACHQMDVVVVAPIHYKGELVAWTGGTCHQIDLGGPVEGQVQVGAKSIYGEQPLVTPIKFVEKGVVRKDLEWLFLRHSRLQNLAALDLKAMIAACNVAKERVVQLIDRYGVETYKEAVAGIIETTEQQFRARVRELPDGTFRHRGYIDADGAVYPVVVSMTKEDDHLTFDFTESAPQAPALVNCCRPALEGATISAILPYLCYDIPWCPAGIARAVEIKSKPGTVVHAEWPAGVSKATTTGSYMATISSSVCMSKLLAASDKYRDHMMATWMGGLFVEELFGTDQRGNYFGGTILDAMAGGSGARSYKDGIDTGGFLDSPSSIIANIEDYEFNYPVLYMYRRQQADTGGPGKFRGGATISMMYIPHDVENIPTKIMHAIGVEQPGSAGIAGGLPSCTNQFVLKRNSNIRALLKRGEIPQELAAIKGKLEVATGITPTYQGKDDVYHCIGMGGGGYGDPLDREPLLVLRDVINGLVTPECAQQIYGVVVRADPWRVDANATRKQRETIYNQRKKSTERMSHASPSKRATRRERSATKKKPQVTRRK